MATKPFLIASLLAALAVPLQGEAGGIRGSGAIRCAQYLETRKDPCIRDKVIQWALGYFSAYEQAHQVDLVGRIDTDALEKRIVLHCEEHPKAHLISAVFELQREFEAGQDSPAKKPEGKARKL